MGSNQSRPVSLTLISDSKTASAEDMEEKRRMSDSELAGPEDEGVKGESEGRIPPGLPCT